MRTIDYERQHHGDDPGPGYPRLHKLWMQVEDEVWTQLEADSKPRGFQGLTRLSRCPPGRHRADTGTAVSGFPIVTEARGDDQPKKGREGSET